MLIRQQETLGRELERLRLAARERRLERSVARLRALAEGRERKRLAHAGLTRAADDLAAELDIVRRRLRMLGP